MQTGLHLEVRHGGWGGGRASEAGEGGELVLVLEVLRMLMLALCLALALCLGLRLGAWGDEHSLLLDSWRQDRGCLMSAGGSRVEVVSISAVTMLMLDADLRLDVSGVVVVLLALGLGRVVLLSLGDAVPSVLGGAVPTCRFEVQHLGLESGISHAGGMAVGDLLGEDGIVGDLVPVDLGGGSRVSLRCQQQILPPESAGLTSLRHFC